MTNNNLDKYTVLHTTDWAAMKIQNDAFAFTVCVTSSVGSMWITANWMFNVKRNFFYCQYKLILSTITRWMFAKANLPFENRLLQKWLKPKEERLYVSVCLCVLAGNLFCAP